MIGDSIFCDIPNLEVYSGTGGVLSFYFTFFNLYLIVLLLFTVDFNNIGLIFSFSCHPVFKKLLYVVAFPFFVIDLKFPLVNFFLSSLVIS